MFPFKVGSTIYCIQLVTENLSLLPGSLDKVLLKIFENIRNYKRLFTVDTQKKKRKNYDN